MARRITEKRQRYIQLVASGKDSRAAAREVGYSNSYAEVIATRCRKNPEVAAAVEAIRTEGRTIAAYDLAAAMKEADEAAAFAKKHKNPMANVKAVELRAKLSGLLVERVEVFDMNLRRALEDARARIMDVTPRTTDDQASPFDLIDSDVSGANRPN